jgi:hypothetical protein
MVDMPSSNAWAELAAVFRCTRSGFLEHERAKAELKLRIVNIFLSSSRAC